MKSGKAKIILIAVILIAVAAAGGFAAMKFLNAKSSPEETLTEASEDTEEFYVVQSESESEMTTEASTGAAGSAAAGANSGSSATGSASANTGNTESDSKTVSFPYNDSTSGLSIVSATSYDGAYLEDGSDEDISDVAVIILENNSGKDIEYAQITLVQGDKTYEFDASGITGGSEMVVQEKNKQSLPDGSFDTCTIAATEAGDFEMSDGQVTVEEDDDDSLEVTNISNEDIACVRVFYKFFSEDDNAYVGGITYTAKITDLPAGESVNVNPSHYISGYSRVIMVRTYDTAEE